MNSRNGKQPSRRNIRCKMVKQNKKIVKMLEEYMSSLIVQRVMVEVVYKLIIQSISKKDYQENKNEIIEQITCELLINRDKNRDKSAKTIHTRTIK